MSQTSSTHPAQIGWDEYYQARELKTVPWYTEAGLVSDGDPVQAFGPRRGPDGTFSWANGARLYYLNLTANLHTQRDEQTFRGVEAIAVSRTDDVAAAASGRAILAGGLEALAAGDARRDRFGVHQQGPHAIGRGLERVRAGDIHQRIVSVSKCTARSARFVSVRTGRKSSTNGSAACSPRVSGA